MPAWQGGRLSKSCEQADDISGFEVVAHIAEVWGSTTQSNRPAQTVDLQPACWRGQLARAVLFRVRYHHQSKVRLQVHKYSSQLTGRFCVHGASQNSISSLPVGLACSAAGFQG